MATFQHPASLNPLQRYRQACSVYKNTNRASNPAWFQDALDLNLQLHIRLDGAAVLTSYYDTTKSQWTPGPSLTEDAVRDPARLESAIADALRHAKAAGSKSLGIVLYVADEFATTELKQEFDSPASLPEIREAAKNDPASIVADSSIQTDMSSWRVLPYPASGSETIGTAITISKQHDQFLAIWREAGENANFPVITTALSAPLVAILGLSEWIKPSPGKPFVAILQYPWFVALAFFNEHSDLRFIRTLQHRGLRRPTNFRNALATTNASLEFVDPDLFLIPLGQAIDSTLDADLRITFIASRVEVIHPSSPESIPDWALEPGIAVSQVITTSETATSHTFSVLREEKWALQDFLPISNDLVDVYPSKSEMQLLRAMKLARVAVILISFGAISWLALGIVTLLRSDEWTFDPSQSQAAQTRLAMMSKETKKGEHFANLLEDRSKAWVVMESFSRMFPQNGGMLVKSYNFTAKPEAAAGQSKLGVIREWKITGFARDNALEYLSTLNTPEGIGAHFGEIARITGNSSFNPSLPTRNIVVNVRTQENGGYKPTPPEETSNVDDSTYPFTFELTITQRFESTDPLAITTQTL